MAVGRSITTICTCKALDMRGTLGSFQLQFLHFMACVCSGLCRLLSMPPYNRSDTVSMGPWISDGPAELLATLELRYDIGLLTHPQSSEPGLSCAMHISSRHKECSDFIRVRAEQSAEYTKYLNTYSVCPGGCRQWRAFKSATVGSRYLGGGLSAPVQHGSLRTKFLLLSLSL